VAPQIAAGNGFSLALKPIGTVAAWGDQGSGQLGNNVITATSQRVPQAVVNLTNASKVAAGEFHAVALRVDGTVVAWGSNADGKLGIGTFGGNSSTPQVVNGLTDVTSIATGLDHTLALRSDRTVWAWGENDVCQLGLSDTAPRATATQVPGLTNVTAIFSGGAHSFALRSDGAVFAWGFNANNQLGLGNMSNEVCSPTRVTALDGRGVVELAAGGFHSLARTSLGAVLGWGSNARGQTGTGTPGSGDVLVPTVIPNLLGITALAAGRTHSVALQNSGTVRTWGNANAGRLGNGTDSVTQSTSTPQVPNVSTVVAVAAGFNHSLVLLQDGKVGCFGSNFTAQCGRIEITDLTTPVEVGPGFNVNQ
jgi:alpha-tubulin suppressor-like RCC1 family protein